MPGGSSASGGGGYNSSSRGGINSINNTVADIDDSKREKPKGTIDAVSEIQQLYVFETRADQDMPYDIFTFRQVVDFFWIGFKGAIKESLLFLTIFPLALTVYPVAKLYFTGEQPTILELLPPIIVSYGTVLVMTIYIVLTARFYKAGVVTRKAIHSLFTGRSVAFIFKAFLGWFLLTALYVQSLKRPDWIWSIADGTTWLWTILLPDNFAVDKESLFIFYYEHLLPAIRTTAYDVFIVMLILAAIPFCTIFAYGVWRWHKKRDNDKAYQRY
jgi:hypothetical protein